MTPRAIQTAYPLGYTDAEGERLMRQARRHHPVTERFFREAGITTGHRVLEIGSGLGDVAMLAASIVGPTGEVVGIEREAASIAHAETRIKEAGLSNVRFVHGDVSDVAMDSSFDAVAGRLILMFLPDPTAVVRSLARFLRPGGVVVFNEISWTGFLKMAETVPLWSALARTTNEIMVRSGGDTDMGLHLHRTFTGAGLPAPTMRMEMFLGTDDDLISWLYDLFQSLRPRAAEHGISLEALGDLQTLYERLRAEIAESNSVISSPGLVGAWTRTPRTPGG